jgi:hypothetical protein
MDSQHSSGGTPAQPKVPQQQQQQQQQHLLLKTTGLMLLRAKHLLHGVQRSRHSSGWCSRCSCRYCCCRGLLLVTGALLCWLAA